MCGIFGIVVSGKSSFRHVALKGVLTDLFRLSESRGKEASGVLTLVDDRIEVYKDAIRGTDLIKMPLAVTAIEKTSDWAQQSGQPVLVMGHARMVTNGASDRHENNQPVLAHGMACIHNGIIVNDQSIWAAHPDLQRALEVDTEVALALMAAKRERGFSLSASAIDTLKELEGANSIALVSSADNQLLLASTNGSLFYAASNDGQALVFASERYILERVLRNRELCRTFSTPEIVQLEAGSGCAVPLDSPTPELFSLTNPQFIPQDRLLKQARKIVDLQVTKLKSQVVYKPTTSLSEVERLLSIDFHAISTLRRCSRCLLPETFPFIQFDGAGVCNYCHSYVPTQRKGEAALRSELEPLRTRNAQPDCLVPLSGGRDSCYGIHYIKNVLGMNPVAYTYDWGMVTDLARRNISRMCGALGIEHILISADIKRKREHVRKNVEAWLKHPHLGTIPLFMAGDKQFFYYADMLKRQMNLKTVLFSMNALERTDFKVGFCGIDEKHGKEKHYNLSAVNKIRLGMFYGKQFLTNPAYLNSSIPDTIGAYLSYYFIPKSYLTVFDYLDWDEHQITETLIGEYNWEVATDTRSTWRIGDGTAPFYNYIYLRVAGFNENDTFRSNQIREGLISRDEAMATLEEDNRPRPETFKWYCDTIGLDCERTIGVINRIPQLY